MAHLDVEELLIARVVVVLLLPLRDLLADEREQQSWEVYTIANVSCPFCVVAGRKELTGD